MKNKTYKSPQVTACARLELEQDLVASVKMMGVQTAGQEIFGEYEFEEQFDPNEWYD